MAIPTLDATFASVADLPRRLMLSRWLVEVQYSGSIDDYATLPERYLWAKIAVAVGANRSEADYIDLPTRYVWSDIYNAITGTSDLHYDWDEREALANIAAAFRNDTENPEFISTYMSWHWRYQIAAIIDSAIIDSNAKSFIATTGATDKFAIDRFVKGIKNLNLWNSMVCWPMRSNQNIGTGTTVYSLGNLGTYDVLLVGGPAWTSEGIDFYGSTGGLRGTTSLSFSQPVTIFCTFKTNGIFGTSSIITPLGNCGFQQSNNNINCSAGTAVAVNSQALELSKFYSVQAEFNGSIGSSSFNGESKITRNFGTNGSSGLIFNTSLASRGRTTPFACVINQTSIPIIHSLYARTLGKNLGLP